MSNSDYIGLGLSLVMLAIGTSSVLGRTRSMPRHRGWWVLLMGASTFLYVILKSSDVRGEAWLQWVVPLLTMTGLLLAWRVERRHKTN